MVTKEFKNNISMTWSKNAQIKSSRNPSLKITTMVLKIAVTNSKSITEEIKDVHVSKSKCSL